MAKSTSGFLRYFAVIMLIVLVLLLFLLFAYNSFTIREYSLLMLVVLAMMAATALIAILSTALLLYVHKNRRIPKILHPLFLFGLNIVLPLIITISEVFRGERNLLRRFYIEVNNIYTETRGGKYSPDELLILLPHCLQNSECDIRITSDIEKCRECGRCTIGSIVNIARKTGVEAVVVTGGTAARKVIHDKQPKAVLSVACERDLASGLADTGRLPVIGIINIRPFGPCYNTKIDTDLLEKKLKMLLQDDGKECCR